MQRNLDCISNGWEWKDQPPQTGAHMSWGRHHGSHRMTADKGKLAPVSSSFDIAAGHDWSCEEPTIKDLMHSYTPSHSKAFRI